VQKLNLKIDVDLYLYLVVKDHSLSLS